VPTAWADADSGVFEDQFCLRSRDSMRSPLNRTHQVPTPLSAWFHQPVTLMVTRRLGRGESRCFHHAALAPGHREGFATAA